MIAAGSNRAKFCWPGNQMFAALDEDLHFGYQKNGSLVIAFSEEDMRHLEELKKRGETNGQCAVLSVEFWLASEIVHAAPQEWSGCASSRRTSSSASSRM